MINIKFNRKNVMPSRDIIVEGLIVALLTTLIFFAIDFFAIDTSIIPKGYEVMAVVLLSVYLKHLMILKIGNRMYM